MLAVLAALLVASCGGEEQPEPGPTLPRISFDIPLKGCNLSVLGGDCDIDRAEVYLVDRDTTTPCIDYQQSIAAKGNQTIKGVEIEAGRSYEVIVLLACSGDQPDCPRCFGRQTFEAADDREVSVSMTPNPVVGSICPPVSLLTNYLTCR